MLSESDQNKIRPFMVALDSIFKSDNPDFKQASDALTNLENMSILEIQIDCMALRYSITTANKIKGNKIRAIDVFEELTKSFRKFRPENH